MKLHGILKSNDNRKHKNTRVKYLLAQQGQYIH